MSKRKRVRGNGEGSIIELSGKRKKPFAVRVTAGWTAEGKQIFKYLSYHTSKSEANAALREYLVNPYDLDHKDKTIKQLFDMWSERSKLKPQTIGGYRSALKQIPHLHGRKLRDIKVPELKDSIIDLAPSTQGNIKYLMKHLYMLGMELEIVEKDLSIFLQPEAPDHKPRRPFTLEQVRQIKEYKHPKNEITLILLYTGMRITEILEMKREHVNLEERYFYGGKKTPTGKTRFTPIHDDIYHIIEKHYNNGNEYLITYKNRPVGYQSFLMHYWNHLREHLDTDQSPHCTRHTFVTQARKCGLDRDLVKKIVGHAKGDVTDIYDHSDIEELLGEINKLKYE